MKIHSKVTINRPPQEVWDWTDNPENLGKWLQGFQRYELISGEPGQVGSVAHQWYNERGREFYLEERILQRDAPKFIQMGLHHKSMNSVIDMRFKQTEAHQTEIDMPVDVKFNGFWKVMGPLMKSAFVKRQNADCARMKASIESGE